MGEYLPTIGLEVHAELKTRTKMFCDSENNSDEVRPNVHICPVCLAHPGTLPVVNREAVEHVLKVGVALGGTLADYSEFDRKNYFYPDLPKGYQISQYEHPLVSGGELNGVAITRVHLEEDTASSQHDEASGMTTIDFNRAGVPLMELVTEPVIKSAQEAGKFARELQLLLRYLGVSEANMEKGEMRVEANVSVAQAGRRGVKVEIKNLNSFRAMERAVEHEIRRQRSSLERGDTIVQETRGWDEAKQATFSQRIKEGSADYRYFPDPDLPSLKLSEVPEYRPDVLKKDMPELPAARRRRYLKLGIKPEDAEAYVRSRHLGVFFEEVISGYGNDMRRITLASNYIANDLVNIIHPGGASTRQVRDSQERDTDSRPEIPISAKNFRKIIDMLAEGKISSRAGKDILTRAAKSGTDPQKIAEKEGLLQKSTGRGELEKVIGDVLAKNRGVAAEFKAGRTAALEYLVGQCMEALRGAADPMILRRLLAREIGS